MQEIRRFHQNFYNNLTKVEQDRFLIKYIEVNHIKRRRTTTGRYNTTSFRSKYFVPNGKMRLVPVCLDTFLKILNVSRFRLNILSKRYYATGQLPSEKRGGDRKSNEYRPKKESVMSFLNKLKCTESHYCRSAVSSRMYLPSELNIKKLFSMYDGIPVKINYFRKIFNTEYNLGFGNPRTDVCSTCLQLGERIKTCRDLEDKKTLITELRVHKLRAKAFFHLLQENNDDLLILSFDCQKNQPLPKIPDQATYYSRQVYIYNFTVVKGHSKGKINSQTVTSYCWTENQFPKGSNEISSCVYDTLQTTDLANFNKIRLMSDGCSGQNKNSTLVAMLCKWLLNAPENITEIEVVFPVTGHSFIPPDRVFGLSEKEIKKQEIILFPEEYQEIFSHYATVKNLGRDCPNLDWKTAKDNIIKLPGSWHFKLKQSKRIMIKRSATNKILVQGEVFYKSFTGTALSICKKGKSIAGIQPNFIEEKNSLPTNKKNDVSALLSKHYGNDWRENNNLNLDFYKHVLDESDEGSNGGEANEINELCEPQDIILEPRI